MPPAIGTKVELYDGGGTWGFSDGQITDVSDENVVLHFTPRPPNVGESFTVVYSWPRFNACVADGYLTIKEA